MGCQTHIPEQIVLLRAVFGFFRIFAFALAKRALHWEHKRQLQHTRSARAIDDRIEVGLACGGGEFAADVRNGLAAKSTSRVSSSRRSKVVVSGFNVVVQGFTCATSLRPRVSACGNFACFPDDPRKMCGFSIRSSSGTTAAANRRLQP